MFVSIVHPPIKKFVIEGHLPWRGSVLVGNCPRRGTVLGGEQSRRGNVLGGEQSRWGKVRRGEKSSVEKSGGELSRWGTVMESLLRRCRKNLWQLSMKKQLQSSIWPMAPTFLRKTGAIPTTCTVYVKNNLFLILQTTVLYWMMIRGLVIYLLAFREKSRSPNECDASTDVTVFHA